MTKPIVLLDCDGPMADFTTAYLDALHAETGLRHHAGEVDQWAIHQCAFFTRAAAEHQGLKKRVDARVCLPAFCFNIAVQPHAQDAVKALQEVADVYVVTSPWDSSPTWQHERMHWVEKHFAIPRARIIQTAAKHLVRGDVFVDDKPSHVESWAKAWPHSVAVLFDMHHNQEERVLGATRAGWPFIVGHTSQRALANHR